MKRVEKKKRHKRIAADGTYRRMNRLMRDLLVSRTKKPHGKRCAKCKSALVCTTKRVPAEISRCSRCNTRFAIFNPRAASWKNISGVTAGIQKCPDRKSREQLDCPVCLGKMEKN